ncbi:MAG: penicillin-binding protein 1C [Pseudomonadales bacterium]|nr:penicillin-binding protein 1C [Pseudomonadales bacterium]
MGQGSAQLTSGQQPAPGLTHRWRWLLTGILLSGLLGGAWLHTPVDPELLRQPYSRVLYDRDGELLSARIASDEQWRFPPSDQLPDKYVKALLLFEDQRFFQHPGVDPLAVAAALWRNAQAGRVVSGGSTITMQLARLLYGNPPRTYWWKFREALLALRLEAQFSKAEILQRYAALAPFGGNLVGLEVAGWRYYGRSPTQLTWAEAALLAILPNQPSALHPGKNHEDLKDKRDRLLQRLQHAGYLDALTLQLSMLEPLPDGRVPLPDLAPHLLNRLISEAPGLYRYTSTLSARLQRRAQQVAINHSERLARDNVNNIALLIIDNQSASTLAYVGNETWQDNPLYGPAVDIVRQPRSSGSLFKPLLYSVLLEAGELLPASLVLDVPSWFGGYHPQNYDRHYRGAVSAEESLLASLNVPAVRLLQSYGVGAFQQKLQGFGLTNLFRQPEDYGLTLILGGAETTLWDITGAYARLAAVAAGYADKPARLLTTPLEGRKKPSAIPVSQGAAWMTLTSLRNRPDSQLFSSQQARTIAWKSGTSYGWHDGWAIGTDGRHTIGVWTGNASGEESRHLSGTTSAAPVMKDLFAALPLHAWIATPTHALRQVTVCKADGYLPAGNCEITTVTAPANSHFSKTSPYHQRIFTDIASGQRVNSQCEQPSRMNSASLFRLPPVADYYYRQHQSVQAPVPPWRHDCQPEAVQSRNQNGGRQLADIPLFELEYPTEGTSVIIPAETGGLPGRVVFRAHHQLPGMRLFWHLDDVFIGETRHIHEQAVFSNFWQHRLVLTDTEGQVIERRFTVLSPDGDSTGQANLATFP